MPHACLTRWVASLEVCACGVVGIPSGADGPQPWSRRGRTAGGVPQGEIPSPHLLRLLTPQPRLVSAESSQSPQIC